MFILANEMSQVTLIVNILKHFKQPRDNRRRYSWSIKDISFLICDYGYIFKTFRICHMLKPNNIALFSLFWMKLDEVQ